MTYGADLAAVHSAGFTGLARAAVDELAGVLAPGSSLVELGCGDGTSAALLTAAGHRVHGIDLSAATVELARQRAPDASFARRSLVDAALPRGCDAIVAVGEVLGYLLDPRADLDRAVARCAQALRPGGLLMFDLAGPKRTTRRAWSEGQGWVVRVDAGRDGRLLTRRIVAFRDGRGGRFRRSEETHTLLLHRPPAYCDGCGRTSSRRGRCPADTPALRCPRAAPHTWRAAGDVTTAAERLTEAV